MAYFEITVGPDSVTSWDDPQPISLRSGDICFTRLVRDDGNALDDHLHAPPVQLAFWLIDNWWRLRWEPVAPEDASPEWRLAHELSAIGGGYGWPRLRIWGDDTRVGMSSYGDSPQSMNFAVRYLTDALIFVPADQFEKEVDRFLQQAAQASSEDREALLAQLEALKSERSDQDAATWRRLEAQLGYDADEAPDHLIAAALQCIETYGRGGVEEAIVAVQGEASIETLREVIFNAEWSRIACDLSEAVEAAGSVKSGPEVRIWESAEDAAMNVRRALGVDKGPLTNTRLKDLLKAPGGVFRTRAGSTTKLSYGLRLRQRRDHKRNFVALCARWPQGRRFELGRTLGDAIWSGNDALGPMTKAKTRRQKFQRSFAQSLLCPYDDLLAYMNTDCPTDDDLAAAARHFNVSERVVQTLLVNKGMIDRQRFDEMVEAG